MRRVLLSGLLLGLLTTLSACSGLSGTNEGGYISQDGNVATYDAGHRKGPVTLTGNDLDGKPLTVAPGRVTVVNVWWSGCGPCRSEVPMLNEVAADDPNVRFVGINIRDNSAADAAAFNREFGVDYPTLFDPSGEIVNSLPIRPVAPPTTYVLDAEGFIAAVISGPIPSKITLTDIIEDAGAPTPAGSPSA